MQEIKDDFDARREAQPSEELSQATTEALARLREHQEAMLAKPEQDTAEAPSGTVWDGIDWVSNQMHRTAESKGWYDPPKSIGEQLVMWHSEISEALEETRGGQPLDMVWFRVDNDLVDLYLRTEATQDGTPDIVRDVIYKYWQHQTDVQQNGDKATAEIPTPGDMEVLVRAGIAKPEGFSIEAADVVIRIMDTLEYNGISLGQAIRLKAVYNATRPHRHGGKNL